MYSWCICGERWTPRPPTPPPSWIFHYSLWKLWIHFSHWILSEAFICKASFQASWLCIFCFHLPFLLGSQLFYYKAIFCLLLRWPQRQIWPHRLPTNYSCLWWNPCHEPSGKLSVVTFQMVPNEELCLSEDGPSVGCSHCYKLSSPVATTRHTPSGTVGRTAFGG